MFGSSCLGTGRQEWADRKAGDGGNLTIHIHRITNEVIWLLIIYGFKNADRSAILKSPTTS